MHIYGMQYDFMHRSCWNHSNFENSLFYNVISTSEPQNHCLLGSRNRVAVNFFNRYVIYWVVPCERARPELSEYVWQRGVGSRVFHKWHFVKIKKCNTSTHPSRVYINQIQKNFFPKTSLEGQTTWSKMEDFYNVDFHSAYSRPGQVKAEWKSTF